MKAIRDFNIEIKKIILGSLIVLPILSACGKPNSSDVPVSIHAVNYSDQEFEYYLQDPLRKSNSGGGESITRFGAGGIMCCYSLPKKWRPELKVEVHYELYFPSTANEKSRTTTESSMIDIPHYGQPQELWLVRDPQGEMSIVLSNLEPNHPNWPGKIKGWPIPSLAYQRERWDLDMKYELGGVKLFQQKINDIATHPEVEVENAWPDEIKFHPELKVKFSGPKDPEFLVYLRKDYERALERSRAIVKNLEETKP